MFATTYQDNLASRRVMEKAGLTLVRTDHLTPAHLLAQGTCHITSQDLWEGDDVEYALEKADWERQETADVRHAGFSGNDYNST
jgi:RimJ/RimL family protein N-acetyltransferase